MNKPNTQQFSQRVVDMLFEESCDPRFALEVLLMATSAIISATTPNPTEFASIYAEALSLYVADEVLQ